MPFTYKTKEDFIKLDEGKKAYYLARLYLFRDRQKSRLPYATRLFSCRNYLLKQQPSVLSVLYNFLTDNTDGHNGSPIWELVPKAIIYDQKCRRTQTSPVQQYEQYDEDMLDDILKEET